MVVVGEFSGYFFRAPNVLQEIHDQAKVLCRDNDGEGLLCPTMPPMMLKNYLYLFRTIFSKHKFRIVLLTLFGFVNGILDSISIGTLIPLFSFIVKDANAATSIISRSVARMFGAFHIPFTIWALLAFMVILFVTKAVGEFLIIYVRVRITTDYENDTRSELYEKTLRARWPYLLNQKMGYLENVLMTDVRITQGLLKQICASAPNFASFLVYLGVALGISRSVTLATLAVGGVILLLSYPLVRRTKRYAGEQTEISKLIAHRVNESVSGMKTIKAAGVVDQVVLRERTVFEQLKRLIVKSALVLHVGTSPTESLGYLFIIGLFAFSYTQPGFSLASFAVVMYLVQRLFLSVRKMQGSLHLMNEAMSHGRHVVMLSEAISKEQERDTGTGLFRFERELAFRNVSFGYHPDQPILRDVSFTVRKREMVGIIGHSGAGKTTLTDLLLRLFEPDQGEITIDGVNISSFSLAALRGSIGYVSQDMFLKNDSIEENIKFFSDAVDDVRMREAAKLAHVYDFIQKLPRGFKTMIGNHGVMLSGGQRQRIVLARVLARKPEILILDEATSALDNESEALIRSSIEQLKGGVTVIAIAHRLSTLMNADRIVVLEGGCVLEEGAPAALLQDEKSYFHRMHAMSMREKEDTDSSGSA